MSDFERSGERAGVTYDEPARRRNAGTWFADLGDRLARGFNNFDRPQPEEPEWDDSYDEVEQPTQAAESVPDIQVSRRRFPTSKHGYDCDAVDEHVDGLEQEIAKLAAQLSSAKRSPSSAVEAELERVGAETSAILKVAHEQASEITRRAQIQADRCIADAAANAVSMTEEANRRLRQLDTETDSVWAERIRLIDDVRNVATSLFSLAEDASERFPEDGDRGGATEAAAVAMPAPKAAAPPAPAIPTATPMAPTPVPADKPVEGNVDGEGSSPDSPGSPTGD
jgi:cell division septum initiation protein DivIVA